jgi:hypothetical protein
MSGRLSRDGDVRPGSRKISDPATRAAANVSPWNGANGATLTASANRSVQAFPSRPDRLRGLGSDWLDADDSTGNIVGSRTGN